MSAPSRLWVAIDGIKLQVETLFMPRVILMLFFAFYASGICAQEMATTPVNPGAVQIPIRNLPYDPAKVAVAIRSSYYHPDEMKGLDCDVSVDWPAFFIALKLKVPADRLNAIEGLKIHSRAARGKMTEFTFDWTGGPLDNSEHFESGLKQMVG